jgi:plastocyanin
VNRYGGKVAIALGCFAGAVAACSRPVPRSHTVTIQNFAFVPAELTVAAGDTVVWSNKDIVPHSATARDAAWDSKPIDANAAWRGVAPARGRHDYYCVLHPNMKATLVVR